MANEEHVALLKQGVEIWNTWRDKNPDVTPDLSKAGFFKENLHKANLRKTNLSGADLGDVDLSEAKLGWADLSGAILDGANLFKANLSDADLREADLSGADLRKVDLESAKLSGADLVGTKLVEALLFGANLSGANLNRANLHGVHLDDANLSGAKLVSANLEAADLSWAHLSGADLCGANLRGANLHGVHLDDANLREADLRWARLRDADLREAHLNEADLREASLVRVDLTNVDLTGCRIYGISAWELKLSKNTEQRNLIITKEDEPKITVDDIEVAQFIYLLLHNEKIRDVIDTITSKAVLILGRFTLERKEVLDALRDELRQRNRTPIVFDFSRPRSKNTTDTVKLLAQMARYIIIDLSDPNSAPYELGVISMLGLKTTPVVPIILSRQKPFPMLHDVLQERWSTDLITYDDLNDLRALLDGKLVSAAEAKVLELRGLQPG
jgi:uncharacterized protein YjbI with pentapeptide repeats